MNKIGKMLIGVFILAGLCVSSFADEVTGLYKYEAYNESPLMRVRYIGTNKTATFNWSAMSFTITEGSFSASNSIETADTIATFVNDIGTWTNLDNETLWRALPCASLSTDDIDADDLTAASAAIDCSDGAWHEVMTVDTTAIDYYDVCPWEWKQTKTVGEIILKYVYGAPGGTGPSTITVYRDTTPIWQTLHPTNVPANVFGDIDIGQEFTADGLRMKRGDTEADGNIVIRATRTASSDSGGIGVGYSMEK